jgi:hypothetical protein
MNDGSSKMQPRGVVANSKAQKAAGNMNDLYKLKKFGDDQLAELSYTYF